MRTCLVSPALPAVTIFLCAASSLLAQGGVGSAQLNGTVTDPSGSSVAGASITLRNTGTNRVDTTSSNEGGFYAIANLAPGTYELKASASGFANFTQSGIVLAVGQVATVNVRLAVASQGETVLV